MADPANTDKRILLGHISGLFGVKGWLKIFSYTSPRTQITAYKQWYLGEDEQVVMRLEAGQAHKDGVIAKLVGIDDRDQAMNLMQREIWVNQQALPELAQGEYYWHQLIGCQVLDVAGDVIGQVHDLMETGANDVLIVQTLHPHKREYLIPYIREQVIKSIDLDRRQIRVEWDLND